MPLRHMRIWRYVDAVARAGSIRQAAERLHVAPSALQRRIRDLEHDLGTELFERLSTGIRLTAAGERVLDWIRRQDAELDRVQSQIADLAGLRRGHVRIACSQALGVWFLPEAVAAFRARYKDVTFAISVCDHATALRALIEFATDLVLIFRPPRHPDLLPLAALGQRLVALMPRTHPLAGRTPLRLRDCAAWPVALPDHSFGTRQMIDQALARSSVRLTPALETNSFELLRGFVRQGEAISLQIEIGAPTPETDPDLLVRPLDDRDLLHGPLVLGQLRGRALPVATAKFAELLAARLHARRSLPEAP